MSQKVSKVIAVSTQAPDQPGTAAGMAAVLRERGIGLKAVWGWPEGDGMSTIVSIPEQIEQLRALAAAEGRAIEEIPMVWLEGPDETGALCGFFEKVGGAGVNIGAMMALGVSGSFAAVFSFADEATVDLVVALMGG